MTMVEATPVAAPPGAGRRRYDPAWEDWNAPKRWPGILLTAVVVFGFAAILIWHFRPHTTTHRAAQQHIVSRRAPSPAYMVGEHSGQGVITTPYHGRGDATIPYVSNGSLAILHAQCACAFNFVVTITNSAGVPIAFPINAAGTSNTVLDVTQPAGSYAIRVIGTGPWNIELVQPQPSAPTIATPFSWYSFGDDVLGPFSSANHYLSLQFLSGNGGAIQVDLLNGHGTVLGRVFSGRNFYEFNRTLGTLPQPYYLLVTAGGYWDLTVQRTTPR